MTEDNAKHLYGNLYKRLNRSKEGKEFYETHQIYRMLYNRLNTKDEIQTEELLHEGTTYLLKNGQFESGTDLLVLLIKFCIEKKITPNESTIIRLKNYYSMLKPQSEERSNVNIWIDKWIVGEEIHLWHDWVAVVLWSEGDLVSARYHFMLSGQGVHTALFLVHLQRKIGYRSEVDLFLAQAVFQFLCLKRVSSASNTFSVYIHCHPDLPSGPPFPQLPLLNFLWFLLLAIDSNLSTAAFTDLCDHYSKHLDRDPLYSEYLARIGQLYFHVPATGKKDNFISNIMSMLVGGSPRDEEGSRALESSTRFSTEEMD